MTLTTAQKLVVAEICEGLISVAILKGGVFADGIDIQLPNKIRNIRESIQYRYNQDPSDTTLIKTSNHLMGMCLFSEVAQGIIFNSGTIPGTVPILVPSPYQFIVDASTSFIIDGQSSKTITAFIGYNIIFVRNYVPQSTVDPGGGGNYYSWTKATGSFVCFSAAATGDVFGIFPV
jgi:hypothetical protein